MKRRFDFLFVCLRRLAVFQNVLRVSVELIALVAVGGLARDRVVVRLVGGDDAAILAEGAYSGRAGSNGRHRRCCRHQNGRAAVIVQARLEAEVLDDAGDDALLALARTHQLFHGRPALAEDGASGNCSALWSSARTTHRSASCDVRRCGTSRASYFRSRITLSATASWNL